MSLFIAFTRITFVFFFMHAVRMSVLYFTVLAGGAKEKPTNVVLHHLRVHARLYSGGKALYVEILWGRG